jgi:Ca2+-binding RTX toxin-like protein
MAAMEAELAEQNEAPEIDLNGDSDGTDSRIGYGGNSPATAIAPDAIAYDDSGDFEGGSLIVEFTEGGTADDQLQLVRPLFGEAPVYAIGKDLYLNDLVIGSITGGTDGSTPLRIDFYAGVTAAIVQEVIRSIGYANLSEKPVEGERFVAVTLVDREGAASRAGAVIDVVANAAPEIDLSGSIKYVENSPAAAIAPEAKIFDDSQDFDGGSLVVEFKDRSTNDDQRQIVGGRFGEAPVRAVENVLYFRDEIVGSITGGTDGSNPLVINFHGKVTTDIVEAVIRSIGYANFSQDPVEGERFVTFTLADRWGALSRAAAATIYVVPVDTPAVAEDDTITTTEDMVGTGSLFDANGPGNDHDPDGPKLTIAAVNGSAADVGRTITLKSGALLTVYEDGTYQYDPNGQFDALTDNTSGAVNSYAIDIFQYTLADGDTATVTMIVTGVAGPDDKLMGDENSNTITGAEWSDMLLLEQGGDDKASGRAGNDVFLFGSSLTSADSADGGEGNDQIAIQGDYSGANALIMGSGLLGFESFAILPGNDTRFGDPGTSFYDYHITTVDSNVAPGVQVIVDANRLRLGEDFIFNGSAESDGRFFVWGGGGIDLLTGGAMNDVFYFGENGQFGASDGVNGGSGGTDQLGLRGNYTIVFGAGQIVGIESIGLVSAQDTRFGAFGSTYNYNLTLNDANVASGVLMTVDGAALRGGETLTFNGSAETNGNFRIFGGQGNDAIVTGSGNDILQGGRGADAMTGGAGADSFRYLTTPDSTTGAVDQILDFAAGTDKIDLSRIDASSLAGGDQAFSWIGAAAFTGGGAASAGELRAYLSNGSWFVEGDTDGNGVADLVIAVITQGGAPLAQGDFFL